MRLNDDGEGRKEDSLAGYTGMGLSITDTSKQGIGFTAA
jgi:hypothetical protein